VHPLIKRAAHYFTCHSALFFKFVCMSVCRLLENTLKMPQNTSKVPHSKLQLPQNTLKLSQNTFKVPQNTFLRTKCYPKTKKVTVNHRNLHNMKFHYVYFEAHIVLLAIKSRQLTRALIFCDLAQMVGSRDVIPEARVLSRQMYVKFVVHTIALRQIFYYISVADVSILPDTLCPHSTFTH
jgi:hypothetical protein